MMKEEIIPIKSISQLHEAFGFEKPRHPLISVVDSSKICPNPEHRDLRVAMDFYMISMKNGDCGIQYGRNYYDFAEGTLIFTAPGQVIMASDDQEFPEGWILFFHADLLRKTALADTIDSYQFFSYDVSEALHLSDREKTIMTDCVDNIKYEYEQNIDAHSQALFVSNIGLLLNYSNRFYERQFHTRKHQHGDILSNFEKALKTYIHSEDLTKNGLPSVQYFAEIVNLSPNYLSDLLKKETGKNTKEHINEMVVDRAKNMLLNSGHSVSEIAYDLGFNYPHYFSRMFKSNTGFSPQKYREVN